MGTIRKLAKMPLLAALETQSIRSKVAYELKLRYFDSLNHRVPLTHGFECLIQKEDSVYSFSEMFVTAEYGTFLELIPFPHRWLDLGCHVGYFSLYMAWQHVVRGHGTHFQALMVDADPRVIPQVQKLLSHNKIEPQIQVRHGAIFEHGTSTQFALREGMGSSGADFDRHLQGLENVPVLSQEQIASLLAPPYDLIKIDIEGGETDFFKSYSDLMQKTKYLLLEWHSWNRHGMQEAQIKAEIEARGFERILVVKSTQEVLVGTKPGHFGIDLYRRNA